MNFACLLQIKRASKNMRLFKTTKPFLFSTLMILTSFPLNASKLNQTKISTLNVLEQSDDVIDTTYDAIADGLYLVNLVVGIQLFNQKMTYII